MNARVLLGIVACGMIAGASVCGHSNQDEATTNDPVHAAAVRLGSPAYAYVHELWLLDGVMLSLDTGELVVASHTAQDGLWWAPFGDVEIQDGNLPSGSVVGANLEVNSSSYCKVKCASGYYPCCFFNGNGQPVCRCRRNGTNGNDCQAGGAGAIECEIGEQSND